MKKSKILLLINSLAGGGAERQFIELVKRLNRDKYDISICLTVENGVWYDELLRENFDIKVLNKKNKFDITVIFKLAKLIKEKKPDIVHCWLFYSIGISLIASFFIRRKMKIISSIRECPLKFNFYYFLTKLLQRRIEKFIAISNFVKKKLIRDGIFSEKIVVVHNGLDIKEIEKKYSKSLLSKLSKESFGLKKDDSTVGFIGRLEPVKGVEYFLMAIPYVKKEITDIKFMVVGEGSLKNSLKELVEKLKIENNVIFTGFRKDVYKIIKTIDILVVPSLIETLSSVSIEAGVFKKPVIATSVGGIPEVVEDGVTGLLVPSKDPERMAEAILQLLKDEDLRMKMGEAGRKKVESFFNIEQTVKKTEEIYDKLLRN